MNAGSESGKPSIVALFWAEGVAPEAEEAEVAEADVEVEWVAVTLVVSNEAAMSQTMTVPPPDHAKKGGRNLSQGNRVEKGQDVTHVHRRLQSPRPRAQLLDVLPGQHRGIGPRL